MAAIPRSATALLLLCPLALFAADSGGIPLPVIGKVTPRASREITSSDWSIGCEVLDRDFASYAAYKSFLGPLGAKGVRLQAGWAKTEQKPGEYNWQWLDVVIDDTKAQGTQPWVQLSYGNPAYPVLVDLKSGRVFALPAGTWSRRGDTCELREVPLYDSPVLIASRADLRVR